VVLSLGILLTFRTNRRELSRIDDDLVK